VARAVLCVRRMAVPEAVLTIVAAATVFTVMLTIGLGIVLREFRSEWGNPGLVARGLFSVLVAVPVAAVLVARGLALPRLAEIGIVLMAISPGAPVALHRSLEAGGHRSFAPALQILVAVLAVASMPLSVAVLNGLYAGQASISAAHVASQVLTAQLLPLGLGLLIRRTAPNLADLVERWLGRLGGGLLVGLTVLALIDVGPIVLEAGLRIALAIAIVTALALLVGHTVGGPEPGTRTAVAISSAARNPGLALLVATLNRAPPQVGATVLVYLVVAAATVLPYAIWRYRLASGRK
jgi:BASS family bile acid:Na+ symporter